MKKLAVVVIIIILGGVVAVGGYSMEKNRLSNQNSNNSSSNVSENNTNINNGGNNVNVPTKNMSSNNSININTNSTSSKSNQNTNTQNQVSDSNNNLSNTKEASNSGSNQGNVNNSEDSNTSTNESNSKSEKKSSPIDVSNYMGVWNPSKEVQWAYVLNKNILPTKGELNSNILTLTQLEYSFKGITIKNPVYKIVPATDAGIFGNERMGSYGNSNKDFAKNGEYGIPASPNSNLYFIVAVPQGSDANYLKNKINEFSILNYPYIVDGNVFAMINTPQEPIYRFSR